MASFFDKLKAAINPKNIPNVLQRLWTRAPTRDKSEYPDLFHKNPRLDAVHVIGQAVSTTPLKVYKKAEVRAKGHAADPLDDHPLYELLENPMPMYPEIDGVALLYLTSILVDLVGEFFWLKIRAAGPGSQVVSLMAVPAAWVAGTPSVSTPYFLIYPFGVTAGKAFPAAPEDVIWFKRVDATDPYSRGRGLSESIADEVEADSMAAKFQKNFFFNDATPPYVIFAPGASDLQAQALKDSWIAKVGGWINARKPAVLNGKDVTIQQLSESQKDVDMINSRKFWRDEANQHYQIPPEIFGIIENSNRSTIDASFYLFAKNVLRYRLYSIERTLDRQLVAPDFDKKLCVRFDNVVIEDEDAVYERLDNGFQRGVVKINEYRTFLKLPEDPKGGEFYLRNGLLQAVPFDQDPTEEENGQGGAGSGEPPPNTADGEAQTEPTITITDDDDSAGSDGTGGNTDDDPLDAADDDDEDSKGAVLAMTKADPKRKAIWKAYDAAATATEPVYRKAVKKYANNQRERFKSQFQAAIGQKMSPEAAADKAAAAAFGPAADKALKSALAPAWIASMSAGRDHALSVLGGAGKMVKRPDLDSTFDVTNDRFNTWVDTNGLSKSKDMNDTTLTALKKALQKAVSESVSSGDSSDLVKQILADSDGVYDEMTTTRAKAIARTEAGSTVNYGQQETYKAEGVQSKEWMAVQDDRTRDDHADADGQVVKMDDSFNVGGEDMDYPGDPDGSAENVINCRCTLLPVLD